MFRLWGARHSCPPLLTLTLFWSLNGGSAEMLVWLPPKINVKGGGQERPPHTTSNFTALPRAGDSLAASVLQCLRASLPAHQIAARD